MATEILIPKLGLTMTEGTVDVWDKAVGDQVANGEVLCTISSEKLTYDVEAPAAGYLLKICVAEGEDAPVKAPIGFIGAENEAIPETTAATTEAAPPATAAPAPEQTIAQSQSEAAVAATSRILITPLARKIAADHQLDYAQLKGTGGNQRITKRDILAALAQKDLAPAETPAAAPAAGLSGMRQQIARHMLTSLQTTAQLTLQRKVDLTALLAFKADLKAKITPPPADGQLSLTTLLARAVCLALQATPEMNANYQDGQYTKIADVNLGIAVGLDNGLIVPVIQKAQTMTLTQLGQQLKAKIAAAQNGTLTAADYHGGTFTITNLGHENIEYFTPVLNTPEIGILGVGALAQTLKLSENNDVVAASELPLSFTFDHQIIDGQQAAQFLDRIAVNLQNPYQLIL